ncbi:MAG: hypothetical protein ABSB63_01505 [Spirochaetia bacterium]|jgi:hypothetical protein
MRKIVPWAALLAALFLAVSCAGTPPAKPTPEAPQPEKPAVAAPDAELAQAQSLQQKADKYGLGEYDPEDYAAATKDLKAGQDAYGKDNAASKESLTKAIDEFNSVITKGGALYLAKLQAQADASKKAADDLKASVAVKDQYAEANDVYQRALKEKDAGDLENAVADFTKARDLFDAVAALALQKKENATKSLADTKEQMTASEQKAADAQKTLKDEGF